MEASTIPGGFPGRPRLQTRPSTARGVAPEQLGLSGMLVMRDHSTQIAVLLHRASNFVNVGTRSRSTGVVAAVMTFVLSAAELDLSVGAVLSRSAGSRAARCSTPAYTGGLAILAALGVGAAAGCVNAR